MRAAAKERTLEEEVRRREKMHRFKCEAKMERGEYSKEEYERACGEFNAEGVLRELLREKRLAELEEVRRVEEERWQEGRIRELDLEGFFRYEEVREAVTSEVSVPGGSGSGSEVRYLEGSSEGSGLMDVIHLHVPTVLGTVNVNVYVPIELECFNC